MKSFLFILFLTGITGFSHLWAQAGKKEQANTSLVNLHGNDTLPSKKEAPKKDSLVKAKHIPRIATFRSAVLPGLGQAYNREYWKIPIVYAALSIPTYTFFYNNSFYNKTKFAYDALFAASQGDSSQLPKIDASVRRSDGSLLSATDYQNYRNQFRKDRDYSILWFFIVWGLNVADATVFAHLKDFDVSSDLTLHVEPTFNSVTRSPGIGLVLNFKNSPRRPLTL